MQGYQEVSTLCTHDQVVLYHTVQAEPGALLGVSRTGTAAPAALSLAQVGLLYHSGQMLSWVGWEPLEGQTSSFLELCPSKNTKKSFSELQAAFSALDNRWVPQGG